MSDYSPLFPWRDYIHMDIKDPVFARLVEQTLNQMGATPEFQDWVETGHANLAKAVAVFSDFKSLKFRPREDGKILLTDTPPPRLEKVGSLNQSIFGLVYLDKKQIGKYGWKKPDGNWQVMTLPALMIHEFFHQAAPQLTIGAQDKLNNDGANNLIADIVQVDEPDPSKATALKLQIVQEGSALLRHGKFPEMEGMSREQLSAYIQEPANQKKILEFSLKLTSDPSLLNSVKTQISEKLGLPLSSFSFRKADIKALMQSQIDPKTGSPIVEEHATQAGDVWDAKYYSLPLRGEYRRAVMMPKEFWEKPKVESFQCGISEPIHYTNVDPSVLGDMPQMSSVPCETVVQTLRQSEKPR